MHLRQHCIATATSWPGTFDRLQLHQIQEVTVIIGTVAAAAAASGNCCLTRKVREHNDTFCRSNTAYIKPGCSIWVKQAQKVLRLQRDLESALRAQMMKYPLLQPYGMSLLWVLNAGQASTKEGVETAEGFRISAQDSDEEVPAAAALC